MLNNVFSAADFNLLSVKDLLEARDHYHVHLMHKENVVATAIGRYLIRKSEPWPAAAAPHESNPAKASKKPHSLEPRTLANSEVRDYSWPCVLVFVTNWIERGKFGSAGNIDPANIVPSALYMPDGRVVPVCVVQAEADDAAPGPIEQLTFPDSLVGGGYPILVDVQGEEHVASVGCLVGDGHVVYALTNRHVAGRTGEPIYSVLNGERVEVGTSSGKQLDRKLFQDIYPEWPGKNVYVDLDIGLVEVHDKTQWTAQVYGIGTVGNIADLCADNISLRLIGCPVRAYGCASREMYGSIHALFYRYKAIGGFEYVADFLIGARDAVAEASGGNGKRAGKGGAGPAPSLPTHPGDSGTLWLLETDDRGLMPLAVQWGGHVFFDGDKTSRLRFALATCLSNVCNALDVELIRDWNIGAAEYWGAVGHYTIAAKAIDLLDDGPLKEWMKANQDLITYPTEQTVDKTMKGLSTRDYVPLADVPDMVWKVGPHKRGGMSSPEHSNHFADMDKPRPSDGKTLLELCDADPDTYVRVAEWQQYYTDVKDESRGLLPFRVWQIWDEMATTNKVENFICAAGIVAHYVGDSCQPLHISYRFNGDPDRMVEPSAKDQKKNKSDAKVPAGTGVHSAYEDNMVNFHIADINAGLAKVGPSVKLPTVSDGNEAAKAVVALMKQTFDDIQPLAIVDKYIELTGQGIKPRQLADKLWDSFGKSTIEVMRSGAEFLALVWQSAWDANPAAFAAAKKLTPESMSKLYTDPKFLPSHTLATIGPLLIGGGAAGSPAGNGHAGAARKATAKPAAAKSSAAKSTATRSKAGKKPGHNGFHGKRTQAKVAVATKQSGPKGKAHATPRNPR